MNTLDKQYQTLLQDVMYNGYEKNTRNGKVISVFGRIIRHNMQEGFPLLTTKKMAWKQIVTELRWFLDGGTNIQPLVKQGNYIWVGDAYKAYCNNVSLGDNNTWMKEVDGYTIGTGDDVGKHTKVYKPFDRQEFIEKIKTDDEFANKWGDLGPIYGAQWRRWFVSFDEGGGTIDQIEALIDNLRNNPDSRRMMVNAWNVAQIDNMKLPPCHYGFQIYTRKLSSKERYRIWFTNNYETGMEYNDSKLPDFDNSYYVKTPTRSISLKWDQRSVDVPLGLPFNIASYGLLLTMLANEVNMVPGELIGMLGDTHIYDNQLEGVKEQLKREVQYELPNVYVRNGIHSQWGDDIELNNYISDDKIEFPLSN